MEKYLLGSLFTISTVPDQWCVLRHFNVSVPSLWFHSLCWAFCRNWSQQKHSWNTTEGLSIPVTQQHHGCFTNRCLGFLWPCFMKSSHAGSDRAPVSPARNQVALVGTSSASWLHEPFHLKHSSSQTTAIQSAKPMEASSPKCSLLLHLLQLLINQRVDY